MGWSRRQTKAIWTLLTFVICKRRLLKASGLETSLLAQMLHGDLSNAARSPDATDSRCHLPVYTTSAGFGLPLSDQSIAL